MSHPTRSMHELTQLDSFPPCYDHMSVYMYDYFNTFLCRVVFGITSTFMGLTPTASLYYGFMGGTITSSLIFSSLGIAMNARTISHERIQTLAMKVLSQNADVIRSMGKITATPFKTFTSSVGTIGIKNGYPAWIEPRIDMVLNIRGNNKNKNDAVVCVSAVKNGWSEKILYLSVHLLDSNKDITMITEIPWTMNNIFGEYVSLQNQKFNK